MAEARLKSVSKSFGATHAVVDVDLEVPDGAFVVLLGPTGAGKTTILRLIAGLENPDSGDIEIDGRTVNADTPAQRNVAMVFQQYSLYPHLSVRDNLAFPLRSPILKTPEDEIARKVTEVAEVLHIPHKLDNKATELSGGEMQRVSIGRALVRDPSIFLMDEPLSSLDAKLRADLRVELKRLQAELAKTLLYVTHDQIEAMTMASHVGVLDEGRLVQFGTPREIYESPNSAYVAARLGQPRINLLPADLFDAATPPEAVQIGLRPENIKHGEGRDARRGARGASGRPDKAASQTGRARSGHSGRCSHVTGRGRDHQGLGGQSDLFRCCGHAYSVKEESEMAQFINAKEDLVTEAIDGLIACSGGKLERLDGYPHIKVVTRSDWDGSKVALISGGGSGHEPAHAGFVGPGMLTAAVCGDVFASPSVEAVLAGILAVTGEYGCLLIVKNYTGDRLNFGLAAERARALGRRVEMVVVDDDVALPDLPQPRGVAGTLFVHKIAGALAEQGKPLEVVAEAARAVIAKVSSLGKSLDTCTVPGSPKEDRIPPGKAELGLGIHGEPGVEHVPFTGASDAMRQVLDKLASKAGQGSCVALLNNLGSTNAAGNVGAEPHIGCLWHRDTYHRTCADDDIA